jgi:uncharacterized damage-inducible protein DinB
MDQVLLLFAYNEWATLRQLEAARRLSAEELARSTVSSFPSLLATLVHMYGAEWVWLERWKGTSPTDFPDAAALESLGALEARWKDLWDEQRAFLRALDEADLDRPLAYRNMSGASDEQPLVALMRHVVNHATYHRGQVTTLLRQLGRTPPSTDYVRYLRQLPPR